jgi:uroporphyrin-3 C-methyltransferase
MNQDTPPGREPANRRPEEPGAETPSPAEAGPAEVDSGKTGPGQPEPTEDRAPVEEPAASSVDQPEPADATADDGPAIIERTVEVRRGGALAGFALLLALAGLAGTGYLWWQQQTAAPDPAQTALAGRQDTTEAKLAALEARIDMLEQAASAPPAAPPPTDPGLRTDVDENRRLADGLADRLDALDARIKALADAPSPASSPVIDVTAPVTTPPPPEPEWQHSEIELLLRVAQRQAALAGDIETASAALADADRTIEWLDDPRLLPVRRQIADDLESLRAVRQPDLDGIAFRLGSLQARVADLPVRAGAARGEPEAPAAAEPDDGGLDRLERKSREFLSGLVRVRDSGTDERVFHTPAEAWFLRRNLELELQAARVAVLTNNPGAYRDSLAKAGRWTEAYFDPADAGVNAFGEALAELAARPVDVEYPDVSGSLRVYLEVTATAEAGE